MVVNGVTGVHCCSRSFVVDGLGIFFRSGRLLQGWAPP